MDGDVNMIIVFIDFWFGGIVFVGLAIGIYGGFGLGIGGDVINLFDVMGLLIIGVIFGLFLFIFFFSIFDNVFGNFSVVNLSIVGSNGVFSVIDVGEGVILNGFLGAIVGFVSLNIMVGIVVIGVIGFENGFILGEFIIFCIGDILIVLDVIYSISGDVVNGMDYVVIDFIIVMILVG